MQYFTGKSTDLDAITDADKVVAHAPHMADRFDALAELRNAYDTLGTITNHGKIMAGDQYKRVASIPAPLLAAAICLEPDLLIDKRKFYGWLDRHKEYCVYPRSNGRSIR